MSIEIWCSCGDAIVPDDPGLCGNCASRLRAELESARNQVALLAMALSTVSDELRALLEVADKGEAGR